MHLYLHAKSQKYFSEKTEWLTSAHFSTTALLALIDNLESTIKGLRPKKIRTQWADYYHDINYTAEAFETKKRVIAQWIENIRPAQVWDLGANKGLFSRIAAAHSALVVSFDIDPLASEANYIECKKQTQHNILPLVIDLNNPSPAIGWHNKERMTLSERGPADMLLALALIHHLAITNNLPFEVIARFFHDLSKILVIEFVPKHDSQVQRLLSMRKDIFEKYTQAEFERTFAKYFVLKQQIPINDSVRTLYLMSAAADG
jgi:ribosomal protein L11 methylase PrmA